MLSEKYLNNKSHYEKLYDKGTVYHCRKTEESFEKIRKELLKENPKVFNKKENIQSFLRTRHIALYCHTGECYFEKEKTIQEWMDRDRKKDELLEIKPPILHCPNCNKEMKFVLKSLELNLDDTKPRVYFLYTCKNCKEKKGVYNTGEKYIFKGDFCPKCNSEWDSKDKRDKNKITRTRCDQFVDEWLRISSFWYF